MYVENPTETAPKDGRVIKGWFRWPGGAGFIAVCWSEDGWVDLLGKPVPKEFTLKAWGDH